MQIGNLLKANKVVVHQILEAQLLIDFRTLLLVFEVLAQLCVWVIVILVILRHGDVCQRLVQLLIKSILLFLPLLEKAIKFLLGDSCLC